eukprot:361138-Pleurochrysis_carterae.AAC.1
MRLVGDAVLQRMGGGAVGGFVEHSADDGGSRVRVAERAQLDARGVQQVRRVAAVGVDRHKQRVGVRGAALELRAVRLRTGGGRGCVGSAGLEGGNGGKQEKQGGIIGDGERAVEVMEGAPEIGD